jgi:hypothetical protein
LRFGEIISPTRRFSGPRWRSAADILGAEIKAAIGSHCGAVIGQLTGTWGDTLFAALRAAGNVAGILMGFPVWQHPDLSLFLKENPLRGQGVP